MWCLNPLKHFPGWLHIDNWKDKQNAIGDCSPIKLNCGPEQLLLVDSQRNYQQPTAQGDGFNLSLDNSYLWRFGFHSIFSHLLSSSQIRGNQPNQWSRLDDHLTQPGASPRMWYLVSKHQSQKSVDEVPSKKGGKVGERSSASKWGSSWVKAEGVCKTCQAIRRKAESISCFRSFKIHLSFQKR